MDGVCSRGVPAAQQAQNRLAEQQLADTTRAVPEARIMHGAWDGMKTKTIRTAKQKWSIMPSVWLEGQRKGDA